MAGISLTHQFTMIIKHLSRFIVTCSWKCIGATHASKCIQIEVQSFGWENISPHKYSTDFSKWIDTSSFLIFFSMAGRSRGSEVSVNAVKFFWVELNQSVKDTQRFSASSMLFSSSWSCLMVSWKKNIGWGQNGVEHILNNDRKTLFLNECTDCFILSIPTKKCNHIPNDIPGKHLVVLGFSFFLKGE